MLEYTYIGRPYATRGLQLSAARASPVCAGVARSQPWTAGTRQEGKARSMFKNSGTGYEKQKLVLPGCRRISKTSCLRLGCVRSNFDFRVAWITACTS